MKKLNKKGFTITELVIVISVIAILSAVMIPTFSGLVNKSKKSAAEQEARNALTVALVANGGQLDEANTYYFQSGSYWFKYENGKLADATAYTVDGVNDETYTKATEGWEDLGNVTVIVDVAD